MAHKKEPPFFNNDHLGAVPYKLAFYETMELFIETLTGTCFELRVSPFETVISVKAKIQRLEGTHCSTLFCMLCLMHYNDCLKLCLISYVFMKKMSHDCCPAAAMCM